MAKGAVTAKGFNAKATREARAPAGNSVIMSAKERGPKDLARNDRDPFLQRTPQNVGGAKIRRTAIEDAARHSDGRGASEPSTTKTDRWKSVAIGAGGGFLIAGPPGAALGGLAVYAMTDGITGGEEDKTAGSGGGITVGGVTLPPGTPDAPNIPGVNPDAGTPDKLLSLASAGGSIGAMLGSIVPGVGTATGAGAGMLIGGVIGGIWDLLEAAGPFFGWGSVTEVGLMIAHPSAHPYMRLPAEIGNVAPNYYIFRIVRVRSGDNGPHIYCSPVVSLNDALAGKTTSFPPGLDWALQNNAPLFTTPGGLTGNIEGSPSGGSEADALQYWGVTTWEAMGRPPPHY